MVLTIEYLLFCFAFESVSLIYEFAAAAFHGVSLKEETIEALRLVKDYILRNKGYMNIDITKDLMESCKSSSTRYKAYLDAQKEKEKEEARKMKEKEIKESRDQLVLERGVLVNRLKIADDCIDQGNIELAELTKIKTISGQKLIESQEKISNGLKRKAEMTADIETIDKKLKETK